MILHPVKWMFILFTNFFSSYLQKNSDKSNEVKMWVKTGKWKHITKLVFSRMKPPEYSPFVFNSGTQVLLTSYHFIIIADHKFSLHQHQYQHNHIASSCLVLFKSGWFYEFYFSVHVLFLTSLSKKSSLTTSF